MSLLVFFIVLFTLYVTYDLFHHTALDIKQKKLIVLIKRFYSWENDSMSKRREIKIKYSFFVFFSLKKTQKHFFTASKKERFENHTGIFSYFLTYKHTYTYKQKSSCTLYTSFIAFGMFALKLLLA